MSARRIDPARDLARVARVLDAARRAFDGGRHRDAARLAAEAASGLAAATDDVGAWRDGMTLDEVADLHGVTVSTVRDALGDSLDVLALRERGRVIERSAVAWRPPREWPGDRDDRALAVAAYIEHVGRATSADIAAAFGCGANVAGAALMCAVRAGLLVRVAFTYTPAESSPAAFAT
ncbi:hypothetical protein ACFVQ3_00515 [Oerskovia sp. NPDC057915]|uniref:hypothetical protein n=1 Tax=Oerskovia sp. NPDC057915 TaxID=3346280 RepID=UPI0036DB63D2